MKKSRILSLLGLFLLITSCKDDIDELFLNPDGSTSTKIEYLFTAATIEPMAGLRIGYNPSGYYLILQGLAPWTQLTGNDANDANMMNLVSNGVENSWNNYYRSFMSKVAEMKIVYDDLPEEEQRDYDVYMHLINIVSANGTAKITDLYGDIPYSEAFMARSSDNSNLFPKFDSQQEVYTTILQDLKEAVSFLKSFSLNDSSAHTALSTQDIVNGGDIDKWIKFANSLRLRLAMRISDGDETLAQSTVADVMTSPGDLVLTNADNIYVDAASPNGLNTRDGSAGNFIARAFNDRETRTFAPRLMVELMNDADDPRRPYYFSTNDNGDYVGVPSSPAEITPIQQDILDANYSKINPEMVLDNLYLPGIVITASEVNFLLAEAAMKSWIGGSAQVYYETALRESVEFYFDMVAINPDVTPMIPDSNEVDNFISSSSFAFDGSIEQLATQKWIHLGVLQANEAYSEYRRFDYPVLEENYPEGGGSLLQIPTRVLYPDNEKSFNQANYEAVKASDTPYTKVWWDKN